MYKVQITPAIKAKLQAILGEKYDLSKISVYETLSNDTNLIAKAPPMFRHAKMTADYLQSMVTLVNSGAYVPTIINHDQDNALPVGRVFAAQAYPAENGQTNLHTMMYVLNNEQYDQKLDAGIINEVSTSTTPSQLTCSACGYNFLGSPAGRRKLRDHAWGDTLSCGDDTTEQSHQIGINGQYLLLSGSIAHWNEQSLVTRGAVKGARVLSADEQKLSGETSAFKLAASATDPGSDIFTLVTTNLSDTSQDPVNSPKPKDNQDRGNTMSTVTIELKDYQEAVGAQALLKAAQADLKAAQDAQVQLQVDLKAANDAKVAAETAQTKAEADLKAEQDAHKDTTTKLTAATTQIGLLKSGAKLDEQGNVIENTNPAGGASAALKMSADHFKLTT